MPAANTAMFSALLAPGLRKVFFDTYKDWPEEYSQIAATETSTRAYEEEIVAGGLGLFNRKLEGTSIAYDNGMIGTARRYTHLSFGLGFRVTREMYDDDQYNVMKRMAKQLARAARQTIEMEFGGMLDDAFTGATYKSHDNVALCSTSHVPLVGGTAANKPTTDADLGISTLRAAMENLEGTKDERGLPVMKRGVLIVVGPTFQWIAKELTESPNKPYTADNEINVFKDMALRYMVSHYMTDSDAWFLLSPKGEHDIKFFWRTKAQFDNADDFDTKDAKYSGFMRFSMGFTDWRGVYGSSG